MKFTSWLIVLVAGAALAPRMMGAEAASEPADAKTNSVSSWTWAGETGRTELVESETDLPDAPAPQPQVSSAQRPQAQSPPPRAPSPMPAQRETRPGFPPVSSQPLTTPRYAPRPQAEVPSAAPQCLPDICTDTLPTMSCAPAASPFRSFLESTYPHPLTAKQKGMLAFRNTTDPFNFVTIAFLSGVSVASDPSSPYGPGWPGFERNFGVAYTESAVGEFFGTFLIPAMTHQDPHYIRLPNASIQRRIVHAITQVVWGQSDYGTGMVNYSMLVGTAVVDTIGDLYVPGRQQGVGPGAARWATAIATAPTSNFVTEFLPDVARRINLRIVLLQRVINEVEKENGAQ